MNQKPAPTEQDSVAEPFLQERLTSLDAYRGLVMISLAFGGFGLAATARNHLENQPDSALWAEILRQFTHIQWTGCTYWDLIQPSFMFMVGLSMAYSYAKRQKNGASYLGMLAHALFRSIILIGLGIFLISNNDASTNWSLMNVLSQIGLGYTFVFLLWRKPKIIQWLAAIAILGTTWSLYETHSNTGLTPNQDHSDVGVSREWADEHLSEASPAWHKNANFGHAVDRWLLNLPNQYLPRKQPFEFNAGGYQTINFLPSIVTMLFGLMCGEFLRSGASKKQVIQTLLIAGALGILWGYNLHQTGVSPLIKRLWSPSWVIFSTSCCCLLLLVSYLLFDVMKLRWLAFPLIVVGTNSIVMYLMSMLLKPWVAGAIKTHAGPDIFERFSADFQPTVQAVAVGLVFWLICFHLYRKRLFVRI
ncbi:MAG: hypothetical protein M2R45_02564 [Verrucomicrobia subdivision 3 bacterium]|nr:hypothetical protein [Limisphaerales bacterium]MCS1414229.1 hypothetical protein [Limisphaerales bacterium]